MATLNNGRIAVGKGGVAIRVSPGAAWMGLALRRIDQLRQGAVSGDRVETNSILDAIRARGGRMPPLDVENDDAATR
jgi:hypothetical protein